MSTTDDSPTTPPAPPAPPEDPRIAAAEAALEASATVPSKHRNNAYAREAHEQEEKHEIIDVRERTVVAANVAGSEAVAVDEIRAEAESQVARLRAEAPGTPALADAEAKLAKIEADANAAIDASLDAGGQADDALHHHSRRSGDGERDEADYVKATEDVRSAGLDLTDAEAAEAAIVADLKAEGLQ